ncbi:MAG: TPM domain-containing protein [Clostridia bacterium]|nr:TPM domain-containing protein [Clostridia bacterium]
MKKRFFVWFLIALMSLCSVSYAANIPDATPNFFVNDFAGIFSKRDVEVMMEKAVDLDQNYNGIQVVVTTVKTIGNESLEVYANQMYNKYGIGKDDMGVLLLVVTEDRLIRAETGDMMQTYIPDSLIGNIMDEYAIPYLRENKFAEGMVSFQDAVVKTIKSKIKVEVEDKSANVAITTAPVVFTQAPVVNTNNTTKQQVVDNEIRKESNNVLGISIVAVCALIILVVFVLVTNKKNKDLKNWCNEQVENAQRDAQNIRSMNEKAEREAQSQQSWIQFYKNGKEEADKSVEELSLQLARVNKENRELQNELTVSREMIENVYALHPNIEDEISALNAQRKKEADMLAAESFDSFAVKRIDLPSSIDNLDAFRSVIDKYQALTEEQKAYVKTDMSVIYNKYEESVRLKKEEEERLAREAEMREANRLKKTIEEELAREVEPTTEQYDRLCGFMRNYNGMSSFAQAIFTAGMIDAFRRRIDDTQSAAEEARRRREEEERRRREEEERRRRQRKEEERRRREEEERRRREEEERRRRQRAMSSSFSSRSRISSGGFSGRGGRSSGGGASGRF